MAYEINWTNNYVEWIYSGVLTGEEIIKSNYEIYGDQRFDDMRYQIVDLSAVENFKVSETHMKHMAHLDRAASKTNPNVIIAVIAPEGPAREVADAYDKYSENSIWESTIFDTREEAFSWLGL